jgi:hypothetical protein
MGWVWAESLERRCYSEPRRFSMRFRLLVFIGYWVDVWVVGNSFGIRESHCMSLFLRSNAMERNTQRHGSPWLFDLLAWGGSVRSCIYAPLCAAPVELRSSCSANRFCIDLFFGLVNPQWGYWIKLWRSFPPNHWTFRTLNQLAWTTEVIGAVLMLIPQTRFVGAMLILISFIFIASQIRLGFLCEMVIVACLLFVSQDSLGAEWLSFISLSFLDASPLDLPTVLVDVANQCLVVGLWMYLLLLPIARVGLAYNFYVRKRLPIFLQSALDKYTNAFGIIIWRVFSADITNFFINVYEQKIAEGEERLISQWGDIAALRYNQVAESITVTSVFTTLKYYASNRQLFIERLLRYARTVSHQPGVILRFEYVSIVKQSTHFQFVPIVNYRVDLDKGEVTETTVNRIVSVQDATDTSPVHEGQRPGSYMPEDQ